MQPVKKQHYLPVEDEMIISWRILTEEEKARRMSEFKKSEAQGPDQISQLIAIEADLFDLVQYLTHKEPEVARAVHLLNRKMNMIVKKEHYQHAHTTLVDQKPQPVTLSPNGVIFMAAQSLSIGQEIQVEMILTPEKTYMVCYGIVMACEEVVAESVSMPNMPKKPQVASFRISVDFTAIREDDRARLVDHILQKEDQSFQARRHK